MEIAIVPQRSSVVTLARLKDVLLKVSAPLLWVDHEQRLYLCTLIVPGRHWPELIGIGARLSTNRKVIEDN